MKKVVVNGYSYKAPNTVKIGDKVLLPVNDVWKDVFGDTWEGTVTSFESDYDGPLLPIIKVLED